MRLKIFYLILFFLNTVSFIILTLMIVHLSLRKVLNFGIEKAFKSVLFTYPLLHFYL